MKKNSPFFIRSSLYFQKTHPWMNGLTVKISAADSYTEEELHVSLKDVTITDVTLTISDLNVFISNAILANTIVYLEQSYAYSVGSAVISNTTFRQLKAEGFQIRVANCFINGDTEFQPPLFDIVDSELTISKSIFYRITGWDGPLLITAWFSRVIIKDVKFIENQGRRGLLHVNFGSEFMLENSLFVENGEIDRNHNPSNYGRGSAIVVTSNSVAIVNDCKFIGNKAVMGSCIRTIGRDVRLVVTNSTFVNNSAYEGGAISCSGRPRGGKLENVSADVAPNRQHDPRRQIPGRSIKDGYDGFVNNNNNDNMLSQCDVIRSSFKSTDQEGAVHFRNAKGKIFESSFFSRWEIGKPGKSAKLPSRSGFDSVIRTSEETFIEIVNSTYESRYGEMVGFVRVGEAFLASKMEAQFAKSGDWGSVKHRFSN